MFGVLQWTVPGAREFPGLTKFSSASGLFFDESTLDHVIPGYANAR